jgi:hypothetical protein
MVSQASPVSQVDRVQKMARLPLDRLLERICWGLFLILIGGLLLFPKGQVPEGAWLLGAGLIMLGLNVARYFGGIAMSYGTIVLGIVALAGGLAGIYGVDLPLLPVLLILVGVVMILRPLFERDR